ncbi:MAG TPA: hypothetical protein ENI11_02865 [Actinobacteria bacterium]|nr:hypothetical protein [Actinomycetota bacterium]
MRANATEYSCRKTHNYAPNKDFPNPDPLGTNPRGLRFFPPNPFLGAATPPLSPPRPAGRPLTPTSLTGATGTGGAKPPPPPPSLGGLPPPPPLPPPPSPLSGLPPPPPFPPPPLSGLLSPTPVAVADTLSLSKIGPPRLISTGSGGTALTDCAEVRHMV